MFEELEEEAEAKDEPTRVWWQWWALILMAVLTVVIALADGATFRASWTIFSVAGLAYFSAMSLYFNEGTWIYLPVFVFLAWAASKLGAVVGSKAGKS